MIKPNTIVSIDGQFVTSFVTIKLSQTINDHHRFEIVLDHDSKEAPGSFTIDKSKDWLGRKVVFDFDDMDFIGIITNMELEHQNGLNGHLILSGYSKTILLESGDNMRSWLDKSLNAIVNEVASEAGVDMVLKPVYKDRIAYETQYNESNFTFLQRLAKQYNEWFYYDGMRLVFGKPVSDTVVDLDYHVDISNLKISMEAKANSAKFFTYNSSDDVKEEGTTKDQVRGLNELADHAFTVSQELFASKPTNFTTARVKDKSQMDNIVKRRQGQAAARMNVLKATSTKQGIGIGTVIKIQASYKEGEDEQQHNYGHYIITAIDHHASEHYEYYNTFEALPADLEYLPEPEVALPQAHTQLATVLSNEDPRKTGRVEVQFQWQSGVMKSPWLRVMTPDAGISDMVGANRGFVFIPEVGDQVLVGFRYGDPNRPFVLGSVFNGQTGAGGDADNKIKSLTTRSGATITIDDNEGKGNITISDPSGNTVILNGDETITVAAPKSITIASKEVMIVGEDKVHIESKEVTIVGTDSVKETSDTLIEMQSPKLTASADTALIEAKQTVDIEGKVETNVKGAVVNLN